MTESGQAGRLRRVDAAMAASAVTALAAIVAEYGFLPPERLLPALRFVALAGVVAFGALQVAKLALVERRIEYLRAHRLEFALLFVLAVQAAAFVGLVDSPEARWLERHGFSSPVVPFYVAVMQVYVLGVVLARSHLLHAALVRIRLRPVQILVASFAILVVVGAALLALPGASADGRSIGAVDALFTSTSAVCVTGLVVRDTGAQFSTFGLAVVLSLIQIGGLGILTFTATFALAGGAGLAGEEAATVTRAVDVEDVDGLRAMLRRVFVGTFVTEAAGALALHLAWRDALPDPLERAGYAAFHSISAFCNAGFALFRGNASLTSFADDPATNAIVAALIVLGGLGFPVLAEVAAKGLRLRRAPLTRHARWVLVASAALIALGALFLAALEGMSPIAALFQSVTLRTAGFNTVPLGGLALPATIACVVLMLVGGSPAGTAGGAKTTTVVAAFSALTGRPRIDSATARRALRLVVLFFGSFVVFTAAVALAQGSFGRALVFEVASALGTVGLSMDYTTTLGTASRLIVCLAMFAGRVGPFALAAAILPWREEPSPEVPAADRVLLG